MMSTDNPYSTRMLIVIEKLIVYTFSSRQYRTIL